MPIGIVLILFGLILFTLMPKFLKSLCYESECIRKIREQCDFCMRFAPKDPNPFPIYDPRHHIFARDVTARLMDDPIWRLERIRENIRAWGYGDREREILEWWGYGPDYCAKWEVASDED